MPEKVTPIEQHAVEIHRNVQSWRKKPILRRVYASLYGNVVGHLPPRELGPRLELGSGMGAIKEFIPDCITSDIFSHPWLDRIENAYRINFPDDSIGALILFDVWHHLQYPGTAVAEFQRVLRTGGRLILIEPAASPLGRLVYGAFHHEPVGYRQPIEWMAPAGFSAEAHSYYAAQGNCWRMFGRGEVPPQMAGWKMVKLYRHAALTYVASGGFSHPQLYPDWAFKPVEKLSQGLDLLPRLFATRMIVVLEKPSA